MKTGITVKNIADENFDSMTGIEGLWPHNISPNRLAVLEIKLVLWLRSQNFSSELAAQSLQYKSPEELQGLMLSATAAGCDFSEFRIISKNVIEANTENLLELANIADLNPVQDFAGAKLLGVNLCGVDLSGANLYGAYLRGADLSDADLSEANLSKVNLGGADLSGALLSNANLTDANLHLVSLALANLSGANLSNANLSNANLSNANLSDANLSNANLSDADLSNAGLALTNLKGANFHNTKVDNARLWHDAGLSEEMKGDLISRGAVFEDA
ncbi:pentapeptide repeat-containing protein [Hydrocoleum sp. CS-953]|uniref:pentapeptide repeat-containing protein n=1 Tax=Hydrocoleum sp. CS-953 TaxID=1671698 RepID=UPI001FED7156|nr:pentapeptide repeat-containing protein [Hydrocoleum sp. CS-953]